MPAYWIRAAIRSHNLATNALIVNVIHYEVDTLSSPIDMGSVAQDLWNHWGSQYLGILTTADHMDDITATVEEYQGATPAQGIVGVGQPGTRSAASTGLSPGLCALISEKTATPKRYGRGHLFLPPAYNGADTGPGGTWVPGSDYITASSTWANLALQGFSVSSTTYVPVVFSRTRAKQNLSPFSFPITSHAISTAQHFLRSRTTSP